MIDGYNVAIDFSWAENKPDRLPALAADSGAPPGGRDRWPKPRCARGQGCHVDRYLSCSSSAAIPITSGLVTSLSRPGGNITGVSFTGVHLQPKRLELLHELVPPPATIAWLRDPSSAQSFEIEARDVEAARARTRAQHPRA